jgi:hypothetical protein
LNIQVRAASVDCSEPYGLRCSAFLSKKEQPWNTDVSLEESSVCIARRDDVKIAGEPEALVRCFDELELPVGRIGLEVCPSTQWLDPGLVAAVRLAVSPP